MRKSDNATELEILKLLKDIDTKKQDEALTTLYKLYYQNIVSLVQKNNGSARDAQDIYQDTLVILHKNVRKIGFTLSCKLSTYLYSIARNLWLNELRKKNRQTELTETHTEYISIDESSYENLEREERSTQLDIFISSLGVDCKKVLEYYYYENFKMVEISRLMGYATEQVAKNKKASCLKKLREKVSNNPNLLELLS